MVCIEKTTADSKESMELVKNNLYDKYGKSNIYIIARRNRNGEYKLYTYRKTDIYIPVVERKKYKTRITPNPRGKYQKKYTMEQVMKLIELLNTENPL